MVRLTVFLILSIGVIIWSWKALRNRHVHGFYRFFVFESLVGLLLINADYWFTAPFSFIQIVSWILLLGSIILAIQGFYLLHTIGRPKQGIEDTTILVRSGIYRYIRHPLYGSLILLALGAFLKDASFLPAILAIFAITFSIATAKVEERENLEKFGEEYASYMESTKRFLPFLF